MPPASKVTSRKELSAKHGNCGAIHHFGLAPMGSANCAQAQHLVHDLVPGVANAAVRDLPLATDIALRLTLHQHGLETFCGM